MKPWDQTTAEAAQHMPELADSFADAAIDAAMYAAEMPKPEPGNCPDRAIHRTDQCLRDPGVWYCPTCKFCEIPEEYQ
jgi:hypothetical protein